MPAITLTITLNVPDGTNVTIAEDGITSEGSNSRVPPEIVERVQQQVPARYREWVTLFLERCVIELGCTAEIPGGDRDDYVNVFAPPGYRRARVAGITYSSSRTVIFAGDIDLSGFQLAQETISAGRYVHPNLLHLDSEQAVEEAIELTQIAIARFER